MNEQCDHCHHLFTQCGCPNPSEPDDPCYTAIDLARFDLARFGLETDGRA